MGVTFTILEFWKSLGESVPPVRAWEEHHDNDLLLNPELAGG